MGHFRPEQQKIIYFRNKGKLFFCFLIIPDASNKLLISACNWMKVNCKFYVDACIEKQITQIKTSGEITFFVHVYKFSR